MDDERAQERLAMVEQQLRPRGIDDPRVLAAMAEVPRHVFVPEHVEQAAYDDGALPIGGGQTISQPYIVALMAQALQLSPHDRVLEIGTGSGYAAAVLSRLAGAVYTVERFPALAQGAYERFQILGYANIELVVRDGTAGLPEYAPFDAITVAAAAPDIPEPLACQLVEGGRLVLPLGSLSEQMLVVAVRRGAALSRRELGPVRFVPLVGEWGWDEAADRRPER